MGKLPVVAVLGGEKNYFNTFCYGIVSQVALSGISYLWGAFKFCIPKCIYLFCNALRTHHSAAYKAKS